MRKLIQGGTVVTAAHSSVADVLVDGEEIAAVGALGDVDAEVVDASGCYVLPGLIDNHTHMAMPFGGTHSIDDYDTGTRAAAAGGTTCIVDFVIQQHPDGLRSSLEEWQERADGAAHVDYGFHMAITQADEGTFADMEPMVEEGVCTFKVFLAYKGVLMVTDDLFFRVLETTRDLDALTMVHCENGWAIDVLVERALAAGQTDPIYHAHTRPEVLEAEATHRSVRLAELAGAPVYIVHVTCGLAADEIAAGQARGVHVSGETCLQYLTNTVEDLERPDFEGARYVCSPPLREQHNQELLWAALDRGVLESVSTDHCPFNSEQKALGRDDFSKIPNGLAMIQHRLVKLWDLGVEGGRITPERAGRHDLDHDRAALRPRAQGRDRARQGRRPRRLRPRDAVRVLHADLAHERRLRPVRGRALDRQRAPHVLPRRAGLRPRRDPSPQPGHGRFVPRSLGARGRGRRDVNADRVLADLRELARLTGGPDGARRVCWTDEWAQAREFLRSRLDELPVEVEVDAAGNLWAGLRRRAGRLRDRRLARRLGAGRRLARRRARRSAARSRRCARRPSAARRRSGCGWSTGPTRRARASGAACSARRPAPGRSTRTRCATCATATASASRTWSPATAWSSTGRASRARGCAARAPTSSCHIEQGPVLESRGEPAAAVLGTFGVERHLAVFTGQTAHAGATPMALRRDTFMATAQAALAITRGRPPPRAASARSAARPASRAS